jgi:hypothetical protein
LDKYGTALPLKEETKGEEEFSFDDNNGRTNNPKSVKR